MSTLAGSTERIARTALLKVLVQATRLASLVLVIVAARVLGPAEFGKFTFAYALATFLGVALEFGVSPVLTRAVARDLAATSARWAAAATLKIGLLAALGPLFLAAPLLLRRPWDTTAAVWLLGLAITLQSFVENGVSVFTGAQRIEQELQVRLVEKIVLAGAGFGALAIGAGLLGVAGAFVLAAAVSLGLTTGLVHRRLARLHGWWDVAGARALARELAPVAQALLLAFATSRLAPVMVALLAGDVAAGYFGAAFRVYDVLSIVPVTLIGAVYPELARTPAAHPRFRALSTQALEVLLLIAWPIALGLAVGAPWLIRVIYGPGFLSAGPILTLVGIAVACSMVLQFCGAVFLALDQPGRLRAVAIVSFVTSVLVTPVLVLRAGAVGAAVAVLVVEAVSLVASLVSLHRLRAAPLGRGAGKGLAAAAVGAAVATLWPAGDGGRLLVALGGYAAALLVLRPVPGPLWARLWRGALGRPGPPSGGGVR